MNFLDLLSKRNKTPGLFLILFLAMITGELNAQFRWARSGGGENIFDYGNAAATDIHGNVYFTGFFTGENINFGNGKIVSSQASFYGNTDIFVVKYDRTGECKWVRNIRGAHTYGGIFGGTGITADDFGNVYITGEYDGAEQSFGDGVYVDRNSGGFVACFDSNGTTRWVSTGIDTNRVGAHNAVAPRAITNDRAGNLYVTGFFKGSVIIGGVPVLGDPNNTNVYIAKYNSSGSVVWLRTNIVKNEPVVYGAFASSIHYAPDNKLYVSGIYGGIKLDFGNGYFAPKDSLYLHSFTVRVSADNEVDLVNYTSGFGAFNTSSSAASYVDPEDLSYYTATYGGVSNSDPINFGNGITVTADPQYQGQYAFLIKRDYFGNTKWVRVMKTTFNVKLSNTYVDDAGYPYVCGSFTSGLPVNFGSTAYTPQAADLLVVRFNPEGEGTILQSSTGPNFIQPLGFALDDSSRAVVTGIFRDVHTFPPLPPLNAPNTDFFFVKGNNSYLLPQDSLILLVEDRDVRKADTANVAVYLKPARRTDLYSFEINIRFDSTRMAVEGIDTAGSLSGRYRWGSEYHISGDTLKVAIYGSFPIKLNGLLFRIKSFIKASASGTIPVTFDTVTVNTGIPKPYLFNGTLMVGTVGLRAEAKSEGSDIRLGQNYPNPFASATSITYDLPAESDVVFSLHNITGELVKVIHAGYRGAGTHTITLSAGELPSGAYYYALKAGGRRIVKKLLIIK
ncbi:MAG: T9SS type A sorting domain-containing protein [Ignavibacteriaceae bacterium]|nr:T9SS type A sorting domain-containing protein [Ignavibacteriaceae bacterium]